MKLPEYLALCRKEAAESEDRLVESTLTYEVIGDFLFIKVSSKFSRVERRICRRLMNNVAKHFSLTPVVYTSKECLNEDFYVRDCIVAGGTVAKVGSDYIGLYGGYSDNKDGPQALADALHENGYVDNDWESYKAAYSKLYKCSYWLHFVAAYC